jgi:hypothetical protein
MTASPPNTPAPAASSTLVTTEADAKKVRIDRKALGKLFQLMEFIQPHRTLLYCSCLLLVLTSSMGTAFPFLASKLINSESDLEARNWAATIFLVLLTQGILTYVQSVGFNKVGQFGRFPSFCGRALSLSAAFP